MAKSLDRTSFLAQPTRFKIAEFCHLEWRSLEEIATRLGRAPGSLSQPETMRERKALMTKMRRTADGRGGSKVKVYRLNPTWEADFAAAKMRQRPELPATGQEVLLIPLADTPEACEAIAGGIDEVEWAAQLVGESLGLLVAPSPDPTGGSTIRVLKALGPPGRQARRLRLHEVMSPSRLQDWSSSIALPRSGSALPSGE